MLALTQRKHFLIYLGTIHSFFGLGVAKHPLKIQVCMFVFLYIWFLKAWIELRSTSMSKCIMHVCKRPCKALEVISVRLKSATRQPVYCNKGEKVLTQIYTWQRYAVSESFSYFFLMRYWSIYPNCSFSNSECSWYFWIPSLCVCVPLGWEKKDPQAAKRTAIFAVV